MSVRSVFFDRLYGDQHIKKSLLWTTAGVIPLVMRMGTDILHRHAATGRVGLLTGGRAAWRRDDDPVRVTHVHVVIRVGMHTYVFVFSGMQQCFGTGSTTLLVFSLQLAIEFK